MKYLLIGLFITFIIFLFIIFNFPIRPIPYFYFFFGVIVFLLPTILQFSFYQRFRKVNLKIIKTAGYFFYLSFTYEILALKYGWWGFPTKNFIGWITIFNFKFPLEELVWWIILFSIAVLSCYEFFDDDEK